MAINNIPWSTRLGVFIVCGIALWLLVGCSSMMDEEEEAEPIIASPEDITSPEELYSKAQDYFVSKDYNNATEAFEEVDRQHPYSDWALRAQIMAAYSSYKAQEYEEAQVIIERFVKLHPTHPSAAYAYYLRALTYYDEISDVGRDQQMTVDAQAALRDVINRFPDSEYAQDAQLKLDLTEDHLAGKEMEIGRYYQGRQEYLSAANRFRNVVEKYQTTTHTPEALHRLVETFLLLGIRPEAKKYAAVLGHNFPGSEWYRYSYALLEGEALPVNVQEERFFESLIPTF